MNSLSIFPRSSTRKAFAGLQRCRCANIATPKKIPGRIRRMYGVCHQPGPGGGMTTGTCTVTRMLGSEPSIVKTTWPAPSIVPATRGDPSFVTANGSRAVLPPIVQVMVCVVSLEECVHAYDAPMVHSLNAVIVMSAVPSLFVTVRFETLTEPSAIVPFTVRRSNVIP